MVSLPGSDWGLMTPSLILLAVRFSYALREVPMLELSEEEERGSNLTDVSSYISILPRTREYALFLRGTLDGRV